MGGSSGGGGSSGATDYPDYMKTWHGIALDSSGTDVLTTSVTDSLNSAIGSSPYTTAITYDPDTDITAWEAAVAGFDAILAAIDEAGEWAAFYTQATSSISVGDVAVSDIAVTGISDSEIVADSAAFAASLDDQLLNVTYPRFEGGMLDINAVSSSAFVIGKSIIEGFRNREVAKHESGLRVDAQKVNANINIEVAKTNSMKNVEVARINSSKDVNIANIRLSAANAMYQLLTNKYAWEESYAKLVVESNRIKIVAKTEETEKNIEFDDLDSKWDLEMFKFGSNLLASISGAALQQPGKVSTARSAIGGALAGGAAGAMMAGASGGAVAGPVGMAAGAALGAAAAFL